MTRALVLGGGGVLGVAWQSGLIAGFAQAGIDLAAADYVLGTSAGAIVGARLALGAPAANLADVMLDPERAKMEPPPAGVSEALSRMSALRAEAMAGTRNPADVRRDLGALALAAQTPPEAAFVEAIRREGELAAHRWPSRAYACTAVDVGDGGFQIWDAASEVDLASAVASSCSVPGLFPPVSLQGGRYMDGGMRSSTNADFAVGHDLVVVVAVQPLGSLGWRDRCLAEEVETLQGGGATVVSITLDENSVTTFGPNAMDAARRPAMARAGLAQAASQAEVLRELWR